MSWPARRRKKHCCSSKTCLPAATGPSNWAPRGQTAPQPQPLEGTVLESRFYRLTFDPVSGAITSLFDKELRRELVDARAPYPLDQYLYVAGGESSRIVERRTGRRTETQRFGAGKATLRRLRLGALGERMIVESSCHDAPPHFRGHRMEPPPARGHCQPFHQDPHPPKGGGLFLVPLCGRKPDLSLRVPGRHRQRQHRHAPRRLPRMVCRPALRRNRDCRPLSPGPRPTRRWSVFRTSIAANGCASFR